MHAAEKDRGVKLYIVGQTDLIDILVAKYE
jgi:hypothetical protein